MAVHPLRHAQGLVVRRRVQRHRRLCRAEGRHEYAALLFVPSAKPFDLFDPERKSRHIITVNVAILMMARDDAKLARAIENADLVVVGPEGWSTELPSEQVRRLGFVPDADRDALFAAAARRIPLVTVGLIQFITPIMQFLIGVLIYGEPFGAGRIVGFGLIWLALLLDFVLHMTSRSSASISPRH